MSGSLNCTPFRALTYIYPTQTAFIGDDKHYNYHKYLTDKENQPLFLSGSHFYVNFVLLTGDSSDPLEIKIIRNLFVQALQSSKNPSLPTELPSTLFEGKKEGDLVHFHWNGHPVELKLHQKLSLTPPFEIFSDPLAVRKPIHTELLSKQMPVKLKLHYVRDQPNFETAFNFLKQQAVLSFYQIGGFKYPEDVNYEITFNQVFKNATIYSVDTTAPVPPKGNAEISFSQQPIHTNHWKHFQRLFDRPNSVSKPNIGRFSLVPSFEDKELEGVTQRTYRFDGWTKRDSLQILVSGSIIWLIAETEITLPEDLIDRSTTTFPKYKQEMIQLTDETLVPSSIKAYFTENGLLVFKFQIQKSA